MNPESPAPQQPQTVYVTQEQSFTSKAILTLVLYCVLYIPGLIANLVFWNEANQIKQRTGKAPAGAGCLSAMLIAQAIAVGLFCLLVTVSALAGRR